MGKLSEYFNGYRGRRPVYNYDSPKFNSRTGRLQGGSYVQVSGFAENDAMLGRLMTSDPEMAKFLRKQIRQVLKEARKKLSSDAKKYMDSDPRKAARAVKFSVYKQLLGGNLSILQKKKGTAGARYSLKRQRKVEANPTMRGGNRRPRNEQNSRLDYYYGADRGFILRFISSGTVQRSTRYGNRGSIPRSNWFGRTAPWHINQAAGDVAAAITEYIKKESHG